MHFLRTSQPITSSLSNQKETSKENLRNLKVFRLDPNLSRVSQVKKRQLHGVLTFASTGAHFLSLCVLRSSDAKPKWHARFKKPPRHARLPRR